MRISDWSSDVCSSDLLKGLPCNIDYINRFKSTRQIKETLEKVASGKIDIIIGTHRLVSKDVKFKDLGLLVVDEEQKFGVSVKEKLKKIDRKSTRLNSSH